MWGAILGDIAGSRFERNPIKTKRFEFFSPQCEYTDDSVCTAAEADILIHDLPAAATMQQWCRRQPSRLVPSSAAPPKQRRAHARTARGSPRPRRTACP